MCTEISTILRPVDEKRFLALLYVALNKQMHQPVARAEPMNGPGVSYVDKECMYQQRLIRSQSPVSLAEMELYCSDRKRSRNQSPMSLAARDMLMDIV